MKEKGGGEFRGSGGLVSVPKRNLSNTPAHGQGHKDKESTKNSSPVRWLIRGTSRGREILRRNISRQKEKNRGMENRYGLERDFRGI